MGDVVGKYTDAIAEEQRSTYLDRFFRPVISSRSFKEIAPPFLLTVFRIFDLEPTAAV